MIRTFEKSRYFSGIAPLIRELADAAKREAETIRRDKAIFDVWSRFVAASEDLQEFVPNVPDVMSENMHRQVADGLRLINEGKDVLSFLSGARVPMPKTTGEYIERCERYAETGYSN